MKVVMGADASELHREMQRASQSVQKFASESQKVAAGLKEAERATSKQASKTMQLAFAVDDLQYGLRGIGNNIPMLVQGFGGGMGLAGAISIAVTAGYALWKVMDVITGNAQGKAWIAAMKEGFEMEKAMLVQLANERQKASNADYLKTGMIVAQRQQLEIIKQQLGYDNARFEVLEKTVSLQNEQQRAEQQILAARLKLQSMIQEGEVSQSSFKSQISEQTTQQELDQIAAQVQLLEKKKALAEDERKKAAQNSDGVAEGYTIQASDAAYKMEQAQKVLDQYKAEKARIDKEMEVFKDGPGPSLDSNVYAERVANVDQRNQNNQRGMARAQQILDQAAAQKTLYEGLLKSAQEAAAATDKEMASKSAAAAEQIAALERLKQQKQELAKIERTALEIETEKALAEKKAREAAVAAKQNAAKKSLEEELEISKMIAAGEFEKVELYQKENALRKEAAALAKETGESEAKILEKLRERERNNEQGAARKKARPRGILNAAESAIRRAARVSKRDRTGGRMSNTDKLALANEERRNQQRNDRNAKDPAASGDKILQQILETQRKQIDVWTKITSSTK